mmetsp:Transcript_13216/g.28568  ORF Transcript_13216/g.28568 Transcript_13216/m.28568 type:complete len:119 (-) Transcript_13216:29-385(-)
MMRRRTMRRRTCGEATVTMTSGNKEESDVRGGSGGEADVQGSNEEEDYRVGMLPSPLHPLPKISTSCLAMCVTLDRTLDRCGRCRARHYSLFSNENKYKKLVVVQPRGYGKHDLKGGH